jgi:hypothetical protein
MKQPTFRSCFGLLAGSPAGQAIFGSEVAEHGRAGRWSRAWGRTALFAQSESPLPLVPMTPEEFIDKWRLIVGRRLFDQACHLCRCRIRTKQEQIALWIRDRQRDGTPLYWDGHGHPFARAAQLHYAERSQP